MLGDKVLILISASSIQDLYSKEITRNDGTKVRLWINVPAGKADDRRSTLFVRTGKVINKGPDALNVRVGDIAILSYEAFNDETKIIETSVSQTEEDERVIWVHANTTYHEDDFVAYADRRLVPGNARQMIKQKRDQIVWKRGDIDEVSQVLGWIRGDQLIANDPYVFLNHEEPNKIITTNAGIMYSERQIVLEREVMAVSPRNKYRITPGLKILVFECDTFDIDYDGKKVTCANDSDILGRADELREAVKRFKNKNVPRGT